MPPNTSLASDVSVSSSPRPALFSDAAISSSNTPPSSPPGFPWERQNASVHARHAEKMQTTNVFSMLGKRKALDALSDNACPVKKLAATVKSETNTLTQMQISLGQTVQKRCKICGMEYVPSSAEDRALHDKYHKQNTQGFDVGKDFVAKAYPPTTFPGAHKGDAICVIHCFSSPARKRKAQAVLEIVQRELGAVDIPEDELCDPKSSANDITTGTSKYSAYLYIRGTKCIGFLLVQNIKNAYSVMEPALTRDKAREDEEQIRTTAAAALKARQQALAAQLKQPLQLASEISLAQLGVCRIWTSPNYRQNNIAMTLLDTAWKNHQDRTDTSKHARTSSNNHENEQKDTINSLRTNDDALNGNSSLLKNKDTVAFSQPTDAGTRLARRWFGKPYGWKVYLD